MQKTFDKNSVLERRGENVNPADEESAKAAAAFCRLFELIRILRARPMVARGTGSKLL